MMYSGPQQRELYEWSKTLLQDPIPGDHPAAEARASRLRQVINYHEWRYYILNDPVISDYEYDQLFKQLQAIEDAWPDLQSPDSPTQRVSSDISEAFRQVTHITPMLSLDNSYNEQDLRDFDEQVKKLTGTDKHADIEYCVEPKFDGGTIALVYEADRLLTAATRGNGVVGEDMTHNARVIRTIPLQAPFSRHGIRKVELRGEALIRKEVFEKLNRERAKTGETLFANPRNTATGGLRTKDPRETAARKIEAFVYQLGYAADADGIEVTRRYRTHYETIELLGSLGFKIPAAEHSELVCRNIEAVMQACRQWEEQRDTFPYEIDGMVIKVNSLALQEKCGFTSHHPRWAIAFKFKAKQATTRLLGVEFQVGKVGSVTPVAKLEPVALAGVVVSSVSLHNEEFISGKDIRIGDTVLVERAGDVIPYIVKPIEELRDGTERPIAFPTHCPSCGEPLVKAEGEAAWRCVNSFQCEAQSLQRMFFHVSKDAMDIEGLGKSTIERFYELGWVRDIADLYRIDYDKVAALEGFGEKSANNMREGIEKAKRNPVHRLLHSLSIHHLGKRASRLIAAEIGHVMELKDWDEERFLAIKDIGPVVARNVVAFFNEPRHVEMIREMEILGVNMVPLEEDRKPETAAAGVLSGKTILFTGALQHYTRETAEATAAAAGASVASGVSAKLNILVVGEKAGSKLEKAKKLGTVQILTEGEFRNLVENGPDENT